ncbi:MAG: hypothetical protein WAU01_13575 [Saprospiraceae bacterium]
MKYLKMLFCCTLFCNTLSNIYGQMSRGSILNKGEEIQIIWTAGTATTEYMESPNQRFSFYFSLQSHDWLIEDRQSGSKKKVEFLPKVNDPNPPSANRFLRLEPSGNLKYAFLIPGAPSTEPPIPIFNSNTNAGHTFELTNEGSIVVKNANGAVVWGPVSGN